MPDKRKHRGKHPADEKLFERSKLPALRASVNEYGWLLTHGYATPSALKLVGDRHNLTARQRLAVMRGSCSDQALRQRSSKLNECARCGDRHLGIDGYNLLITIESALSGGAILVAKDGCYRDLAGVHGTYRKVEETIPALETILDHLQPFDLPHIDWYLDRPVSNSGRLKALLAELLEKREPAREKSTKWNIELVDSPDAVLSAYSGIIATSDSVVLDRCEAWTNLAAEIIDTRIGTAWKIDLRTESTEERGD